MSFPLSSNSSFTLSTSLSSHRPVTATKGIRRSVVTCANSPFPELDSHLIKLRKILQPNVVQISTDFVAPYHEEFHNSHHVAIGTRIDSKLVVTSAYAVGRIPSIPLKVDEDSYLYEGYIGNCVASVPGGRKSIKMIPLAVSFATDVAVFELEKPNTLVPDISMVAFPPEKESLMMSLSPNEKVGWPLSIELANVRGQGRKSIKAKAPWAFDDESAWLEYDSMTFQRGPPPPTSHVYDSLHLLSGSISGGSGSPWFNLEGELVGISSWEFNDERAKYMLAYATSVENIRAVLHYLRNKAADDPIIMDKWIKMADNV